jgi:CubicO group peptidase (beta-lactamase class C family)
VYTDQQLSTLLSDIQQRTGVPGLGVTLIHEGTGHSATVGRGSSEGSARLTPESKFQLGCITKLLTSLVVLELCNEGTLDLDLPIAEYLGEFGRDPKSRAISIRHLASHTSGYQGTNLAGTEEAHFYSWTKFVEFFRNTPQMFSPGTVFNYDHSECVILGEIVRRVTGATPAKLTNELVFEPLGVRTGTIAGDRGQECSVADHVFDRTSQRYKNLKTIPYCDFWAASLSDITINLPDLTTLGEALIGRAWCRLKEATIRAAQTQTILIPPHAGGTKSERLPERFGFGCAEYAGGLFGHNGSARGQTCGFRFDRANGLVIVVALNAWEPYVRDLILEHLVAQTSQPAPPSTAHDDTWNLRESEGTYLGGVQGVTVVARMDGERLALKITNERTHTALCGTVGTDGGGRLVWHSEAKHLSVALFRDVTSDAPCVMIGMNAFKRVA